ncbi:phasin family protein [Caballeronia sp. Lep1P3]|uniref:phasin family protein n=1 Tax=Caballeronia sp. Lep1P3 TaxID=2878150 RepID=UPI001FD4FDBD|nr:phasin family protein [Caballeronia sp. Lep1P3]
MSSLAPEQLLASQQAGLDATFGLATQAVQGFEKLIDLNVRTLRTALAEQQELVGKTFTVRDVQEFFALQNAQIQHNAQRTQTYWQNVSQIATDVRGAYLQAAQDQLAKSQRNAQAFVESFVSSAPAGSDAVVSAWRSAIDAATQSANSAYEAARSSARQVVEAAQSDAGNTAVTAVAPSQPAPAEAPVPAVRVVPGKPAGSKK